MAITKLAVHPIAEIFPMLSDDELTKSADDIKENGLLSDGCPVIRSPGIFYRIALSPKNVVGGTLGGFSVGFISGFEGI